MKAKIVCANHINWKMIFTQQLFYQQIKATGSTLVLGIGFTFQQLLVGSNAIFCLEPESAPSHPLCEGCFSQLCGLCKINKEN